MAKKKKYSHLKGKIPVSKAERTEALQAVMDERKDKTITDLAKEYNDLTAKHAIESAALKKTADLLDALDVMIREKLEGMESEGIDTQGFVWSETYEPFPVLLAADVGVVVKYFQEHGMEDQLTLKASELAARLKTFVKEEAAAGEFETEERKVIDPVTGEESTVTDVKSKVTGVRIFLKSTLSRTKSSN